MKNIKLDKETFIRLMTLIKNNDENREHNSSALADLLYNKNFFVSKIDLKYTLYDIITDHDFIDGLLDIIIQSMDDTENDWIAYYVYELNWGKENDRLKVYKKDGVTEIPLTTIEDLWNILVTEKEID